MKYKKQKTIMDKIAIIFLPIANLTLQLVSLNYKTFVWGMGLLPPRYMRWSSRIRARHAYFQAQKRVPAYRKFISTNKGSIIPETDKSSYITPYSIRDRSIHGVIPNNDVSIDESSGSTGKPYQWVRTLRERREAQKVISYFASFCFGEEPWITINAFSMGSWATGLNMGIALERISIVKNTGPDLEKIFSTLSFFGPYNPYLILGYPPFLKHFVDEAEKRKFPLHQYNLSALVGGEGMSEGLRDYLCEHFAQVYSGYGATDLEIGLAGETPQSVAIRRLARDNESLRHALFGKDSRLPMVFQYNPLMHYIEVNEKNEIIVTITRASVLSPRIRYNIHDEGGICRYDEMAAMLAEYEYNLKDLSSATSHNLKMPFLWIYGRSDFTISVMGANIYPEDLELCIYKDPKLRKITRSFCQSIKERPDQSVQPSFFFEIEGNPTEKLTKYYRASILKNLLQMNADFREAWHEYSETLTPEVQLFPVGQGPFAMKPGQIKQVRLIKNPQAQ